MNPTEVTTDIHLRFNKQIHSSDNTLNGKFQTRFILKPCQGCGSPKHPLLILDSDVITSDTIRYKYKCHVVDESPLYSDTHDGIQISYLLSSRTYAEYYDYDIEEATNKLILRANNAREIQPDYYNVFMNDVRRICIEHQREKVRPNTRSRKHSDQTDKKKTPNKRKVEKTKSNTTEESKYSTPPTKKVCRPTNSDITLRK